MQTEWRGTKTQNVAPAAHPFTSSTPDKSRWRKKNRALKFPMAKLLFLYPKVLLDKRLRPVQDSQQDHNCPALVTGKESLQGQRAFCHRAQRGRAVLHKVLLFKKIRTLSSIKSFLARRTREALQFSHPIFRG